MSENFDNLLDNALAEFDAVERSSYLPAPGAPAVRHKVAVRRRVRLAAFSVAGAMLVAVPIAAYAANPRGNNSPPNVVGSASPVEPASPTPSVGPSSASPSSTPASSAPTAADLRNATLKLPAFPGLEDGCKAKGTRKFVNGTTKPADGVKLVIGELAPIVADLDGVPGDEQLTTIRCQNDGSVNPPTWPRRSPTRPSRSLTASFGSPSMARTRPTGGRPVTDRCGATRSGMVSSVR
ncbi:hypothetical protein GCM10027452_25190 [Micromonospora halotolerans]